MTKKESFVSGMLYMMLSGSSLAFLGLLARFLAGDLAVSAIIFWRFFTAFVLGACGFILCGQWKGLFHIDTFWMQMLRTGFMLMAQYSYFYYLLHNSLMNATVLLNLGPIFIPIIEWGILRRHVGKSTWAAVIVSFIGVLFVLQPDKGIFSMMSLIGLMAGIGQGASQTIFGMTAREKTPYLGVVHLMMLGALASLIPYLIFGTTWMNRRPEIDISVVLFLGLASLLNQFTRVAAYTHGSPSRLSVFLYISVLIAAIFDWAVYHQAPTLLSAIGAALVVFGGILKVFLRNLILRGKKSEQ